MEGRQGSLLNPGHYIRTELTGANFYLKADRLSETRAIAFGIWQPIVMVMARLERATRSGTADLGVWLRALDRPYRTGWPAQGVP
jgi:hypothetical protein